MKNKIGESILNTYRGAWHIQAGSMMDVNVCCYYCPSVSLPCYLRPIRGYWRFIHRPHCLVSLCTHFCQLPCEDNDFQSKTLGSV